MEEVGHKTGGRRYGETPMWMIAREQRFFKQEFRAQDTECLEKYNALSTSQTVAAFSTQPSNYRMFRLVIKG